jgi:hypothetical protein
MSTHSVSLRIVPDLALEGRFWIENGDWNGSVDDLSVVVRAGSFEEAKHELASALGKRIKDLLRESHLDHAA